MGKSAFRITILCIFMALQLSAHALQSANPSQPVTLDDIRQALYSYDPDLPLNAKLKRLPDASPELAALRTRYHLIYDSVHDQKVTAIFAMPKKAKPPYPAVVLLAGSGGHKDSDYVRISADMMATLGFATISIDAQYHGERERKGRSGDYHLIYDPTNRDAWIQTVVDLRRAVDFLCSRPQIDQKRIGYLGFSQGSMAGGTFLGVEPRIACACLMVGGGDFMDWLKLLPPIPPKWEKFIAADAAMTDPIYFIGHFAPHPLLMLSGKHDELIPRSSTMALFNAAGEPKQLIWYDSGHILPPTALVIDARAFFKKNLGMKKP
jgi:cephalosporin-C deacetylase-like acetyl esterase